MKKFRIKNGSYTSVRRYDRRRVLRLKKESRRTPRAKSRLIRGPSPRRFDRPDPYAIATNVDHEPQAQDKPWNATDNPSPWWVHVWSGLVRDPAGRHYNKIRQAIWLYLYLLGGANWKTGILFRRIATIAAETGFARRSITRWLGRLRKHGYIQTTSTGRSLTIAIKKWRPISRKRKP
jgi:hypothetical protein